MTNIRALNILQISTICKKEKIGFKNITSCNNLKTFEIHVKKAKKTGTVLCTTSPAFVKMFLQHYTGKTVGLDERIRDKIGFCFLIRMLPNGEIGSQFIDDDRTYSDAALRKFITDILSEHCSCTVCFESKSNVNSCQTCSATICNPCFENWNRSRLDEIRHNLTHKGVIEYSCPVCKSLLYSRTQEELKQAFELKQIALREAAILGM